MDKITNNKYSDFYEFYCQSFNLVKEIKNKTIGMSANSRVDFARSYIIKDIMNKYINFGVLSKETIDILETSSNLLKFSTDNLIKNLIIHSDVKYDDYLKIPKIAKNPSKIVKSRSNYDVMLLKNEEKCYKLVIKTTKNRKENFIKSFHIIQLERFERY